MRKKLTETDILNIIKLYQDGASLSSIRKQYHISKNIQIYDILNQHNIHIRTTEEQIKLASKKRRQTCLERYGVEYNFQSEATKKKSRQTMIQRYGVEYAAQSEEVRQKYQQTNLERYGVGYPIQSDYILDKLRKTKLERYGNSNFVNTEKAKLTCLQKYGVDNPAKSDIVKEKFKQTCLKKYGYTCHFTDSVKNRTSDQWEAVKQKEYETKRRNNSFSTSKPEDLYYEYLLSIYEEDDIIRQYRSDKYPFSCDFYIISEDLYIECNYSWTHGPHPFDKDNKEDQQLLEKWKIKSGNSDYYKQAIYTWTDLDIRKQKIAKDNNLNYITLYNN